MAAEDFTHDLAIDALSMVEDFGFAEDEAASSILLQAQLQGFDVGSVTEASVVDTMRRCLQVAALELVKEECRVIALDESAGSEIGLWEGSADATEVSEFWAQHPRANLGIAMGDEVWALEVRGERGQRSLEIVCRLSGKEFATRTIRVGDVMFLLFEVGGGRCPSSSKHLLPNIHVRGRHAFVPAPPSRLASGARARWVSRVPPIRPPVWLSELVSNVPSESPQRPQPRIGR